MEDGTFRSGPANSHMGLASQGIGADLDPLQFDVRDEKAGLCPDGEVSAGKAWQMLLHLIPDVLLFAFPHSVFA